MLLLPAFQAPMHQSQVTHWCDCMRVIIYLPCILVPAGNTSAPTVTDHCTSKKWRDTALSDLLQPALGHQGAANLRALQDWLSPIASARRTSPKVGACCAEGGCEGQWLHSLTLAAALLERIPSVRARIAGASGSITCADDLSRQLIMPAMQHGSATVR